MIFDQHPAGAARTRDRYRGIVGAHCGVTGNARRPDISVIYDRPDDPRFIIVEVKRTANERYVSDSIYKVFGYLYDFAALWTERQPDPRSVLLIPEGISLVPGRTYPETAIVSGDDRAALAEALRTAIL